MTEMEKTIKWEKTELITILEQKYNIKVVKSTMSSRGIKVWTRVGVLN